MEQMYWPKLQEASPTLWSEIGPHTVPKPAAESGGSNAAREDVSAYIAANSSHSARSQVVTISEDGLDF